MWDQVAETCVELADRAGAMLQAGVGAQGRHKADGSVVTDVDEAVNAMVAEVVAHKFPGHGLVGEEQSVSGDSEWQWVCDPVDGTMPYVAGMRVSSFAVTACRDGVPQACAVTDVLGRTWQARRGEGAWGPTGRLQVSGRQGLDKAVVDLEVWKHRRGMAHDALLGQRALPLTICATVHAGALVAQGGFDALVYDYNSPWDVAACELLVTEAGGRFAALDGSVPRLDGPVPVVVAATPGVWDQVAEVVREVVDAGPLADRPF